MEEPSNPLSRFGVDPSLLESFRQVQEQRRIQMAVKSPKYYYPVSILGDQPKVKEVEMRLSVTEIPAQLNFYAKDLVRSKCSIDPKYYGIPGCIVHLDSHFNMTYPPDPEPNPNGQETQKRFSIQLMYQLVDQPPDPLIIVLMQSEKARNDLVDEINKVWKAKAPDIYDSSTDSNSNGSTPSTPDSGKG